MTITRITCGDLAALGGRWDRLYQHHPRDLDPEHDTLCHCYPDPVAAASRSGGRPVHCREVTRLPVAGQYLLVLCCLCAPRLQDALRGVRDRALHEWLMAQCDQAVAYRSRRRREPVPVSREPEAAGVAR